MEHWIYSVPEMCKVLWLHRLIKIPEKECLRYRGIGGFLKGGLADYGGVMITIFAACMLLLLIINSPKLIKLNKEGNGIERSIHEALLFRSIIPFVLTIMIICVSIAGQNPVMLKVTKDPVQEEQSITNNNTYVQRFVAPEERDLESIVLKFTNPKISEKNRDFIVFSLVSVKDNAVLYQKRVGAPLIPNDEKYRLSLKGVHVEAGQSYEFKIERYGSDTIPVNEKACDKVHTKINEVYPYCTGVINENMDKLMINGEYVDKQLFMILR
jgi:hypothetical protein